MAHKKLKPWFGPGGDRTLGQQLTGLGPLLQQVEGKAVLDVGCAEGLISLRLAGEGASTVHGLDIRPDFVEAAKKARGSLPCLFEVADANGYHPRRTYDIVIMLAVLQKLSNPSTTCARLASAARELVVIRLPPKTAPVIIDARSGFARHDINNVMYKTGFECVHTALGHLDEWVGYYERKKP